MKLRFLIPLLFCVSAWASFSSVQHVPDTACPNSGPCSVTVSSTGTGHVIIVSMAFQGGIKTLNSVTGGGTYTHCVACEGANAGGGASTDVWYTLASTSGTTSISITYGSFTPTLITADEYSFTGSSVALDVGNNVNNTTNTLRGGVSLAALTGSNDLLIQVIACGTGGTTVSAISGAYTTNTDFATTNVAYAVAMNSAVGTAPTWTFSGNSQSAGSGLAISETSAGASGGGGTGGNAGIGGKAGVGL